MFKILKNFFLARMMHWLPDFWAKSRSLGQMYAKNALIEAYVSHPEEAQLEKGGSFLFIVGVERTLTPFRDERGAGLLETENNRAKNCLILPLN